MSGRTNPSRACRVTTYTTSRGRPVSGKESESDRGEGSDEDGSTDEGDGGSDAYDSDYFDSESPFDEPVDPTPPEMLTDGRRHNPKRFDAAPMYSFTPWPDIASFLQQDTNEIVFIYPRILRYTTQKGKDSDVGGPWKWVTATISNVVKRLYVEARDNDKQILMALCIAETDIRQTKVGEREYHAWVAILYRKDPNVPELELLVYDPNTFAKVQANAVKPFVRRGQARLWEKDDGLGQKLVLAQQWAFVGKAEQVFGRTLKGLWMAGGGNDDMDQPQCLNFVKKFVKSAKDQADTSGRFTMPADDICQLISKRRPLTGAPPADDGDIDDDE